MVGQWCAALLSAALQPITPEGQPAVEPLPARALQPSGLLAPSTLHAALPRLALVAVLATIVLAYVPFLYTGFAATDSLTLIETSRFNNAAEAVQLFTRPVMAGTSFAFGEVVYRPFVSLTFGLDYVLWGLNAFGYHFTNLLLHVATTACVWLLARQLGLAWWSSLAGAAIFALHPLVVASVPVIARRDSILPVLAFTAATVMLVHGARTHGRRRWLLRALAMVLFAIALLSKESAFPAVAMLPMLVIAAQVDKPRPILHAARVLRVVCPVLVLAGVVFAIRWSVLGGLGGSLDHGSPLSIDLYQYRQTLGAFTRDLLWPFAWIAPSPRELWATLGALLLAAALLSIPWLPRRQAVVALAGTFWIVGFGVFCAVFKITTISWLAYFALVGVALLVASGLEGSSARLAASARLPAHQRAATLVFASALVMFSVSSLAASAVFRNYDQWRIAGEVSRQYTDELSACLSSAPQATQLRLYRVPADYDDGRFENGLLGVTLLQDYTLQSAAQLLVPDRPLSVSVASFETLRQGPDSLRFTCSMRSDRLELTTLYAAQ
jgi:hypothetical protein